MTCGVICEANYSNRAPAGGAKNPLDASLRDFTFSLFTLHSSLFSTLTRDFCLPGSNSDTGLPAIVCFANWLWMRPRDKPSAPQGTHDVAGSACAPWYCLCGLFKRSGFATDYKYNASRWFHTAASCGFYPRLQRCFGYMTLLYFCNRILSIEL